MTIKVGSKVYVLIPVAGRIEKVKAKVKKEGLTFKWRRQTYTVQYSNSHAFLLKRRCLFGQCYDQAFFVDIGKASTIPPPWSSEEPPAPARALIDAAISLYGVAMGKTVVNKTVLLFALLISVAALITSAVVAYIYAQQTQAALGALAEAVNRLNDLLAQFPPPPGG